MDIYDIYIAKSIARRRELQTRMSDDRRMRHFETLRFQQTAQKSSNETALRYRDDMTEDEWLNYGRFL